jgi:hypothetical protein
MNATVREVDHDARLAGVDRGCQPPLELRSGVEIELAAGAEELRIGIHGLV